MTDQLYQINVAFVPREDRLLLRVSTKAGDEYRIWLTRRFTRLLHGVLDKQMERYGGEPTLASSQETRQMFRQGAMEKSYEQEHSASYPLGENGVLAFRVNATPAEDGNLSLQLLPEQGQGVTLNLNKALLYMFYNLLNQGIYQADWQISGTGDRSKNVH